MKASISLSEETIKQLDNLTDKEKEEMITPAFEFEIEDNKEFSHYEDELEDLRECEQQYKEGLWS